MRQRREVTRYRVDLIAMAHPDFSLARHTAEQDLRVAVVVDRAVGPSILADHMALHSAAERLAHQLHPIADAEYGDAKVKDCAIALGSALGVNTGWSTGKNDAFGGKFANARRRDI